VYKVKRACYLTKLLLVNITTCVLLLKLVNETTQRFHSFIYILNAMNQQLYSETIA